MKDETNSFLRFYFACRHRFKKLDQTKIEKLQLRKARSIVQFAYHNSKFFENHYEGYDLSDVWSLPSVNKRIMMENLSEYNTSGLKKEDLIKFCLEVEKNRDFGKRYQGYNVAMSSGTSGNKGIVITSPQEEKYLQAAFFARFPFPRVLKIKWAFILRITTPALNVSKFGQRLHYISLLDSMDNIKAQLEDLNPNILSGPPSMLKQLAKEVNEERLDIHPKRIVSYAEVLTPEVKKMIEETFDLKVFQIYQGSEGPIGMPCKQGNLHINEDLIHVETVDQNDLPTPLGKPCHKMIVTDLNKKSQPIIRYELDDNIIISDEKCSCGSQFRVIESILGRTDNLFWAKIKKTEKLQCIFPDFIRRAIISSSEKIEDYQVIQKNLTNILIRLSLKAEDFNQEILIKNVKTNIINVFNKLNCVQPQIDLLFEKPKVNPNSSKLIRIIRDFDVDF
jgi:putative adenylate-forming enzyme